MKVGRKMDKVYYEKVRVGCDDRIRTGLHAIDATCRA